MVKGNNSKIKSIKAKEILDSRKNPTIEVELETGSGKFLASVPSGASKGKYEAKELRDEDGRGVSKAIENIEKIIAPAIIKKEIINQKEADDLMNELDGTQNKSNLGANAILAISMAVCRALAADQKLPLYKYIAQLVENSSPLIFPKPMFNILNGGAHAGNDLRFQEFIIIPQGEKFSENFQIGEAIYNNLAEIIEENLGKTSLKIGDEGGFAPPLNTPEEALDLIRVAIAESGYADSVKIALDVAASQFYGREGYEISSGKIISRQDLLDYYLELINKYPIISFEDPFAENDLEGWRLFANNESIRKSCLIIGDDLTATNVKRMEMVRQENLVGGVVIKPNQIGSVSEAIRAVRLAKSFGWKVIVSHRSGETMDDFISDLAAGVGADFIKAGAPAKKERLAKYNRLLEIEKEIKS